jgi:hypothetical protein
MDTLGDVVSDIRIFLYGGMTTLPLTIAGTMLLMGLFTANYAMIFFLLGYLLLSPLFTLIVNLILPDHALFPDIPNRCRVDYHHHHKIDNTASSTPASSSPTSSTALAATTWMSMVSFFLGYMINNASQLFSRESPDESLLVTSDGAVINKKILNRKSQALMSLISIVVFAVIVVYFRYSIGCDSFPGIIVTFLLSGTAGFFWYYTLSGIGQDRLSDLFGIANRLLPPSAIQDQPIACLPIPA